MVPLSMTRMRFEASSFTCWNCSATRFFIFFFQAEDGIRDLYVTGVQTCALPISSPAAGRVVVKVEAAGVNYIDVYQRNGLYKVATRSEERRVGKECRSRWSP